MLTDFRKLSNILLRLYRTPILVWLVFQIVAILLYRRLTIVDDMHARATDTDSKSAILFFAALMSLGYAVLLIFLGHLFSSAQRSAWLRQLPISTAAFNIYPVALIILQGLAIRCLIPWGAFNAGVSVFTISIPIAIFIVIKNAHDIVTALVKASAVGIVLCLLWLYGFYDWSAVHAKLEVEAAATLLFTAIWMLLAGRERRYFVIGTIGLMAIIGGEWISKENTVPRNFSEAVLAYDFSRSQRTWENFKAIALSAEKWEAADQAGLPKFILYRGQDFVARFTPKRN